MTRRTRKALIIGAGIAGPVTAIFLRKAGIDAEVFEAWPYSTGIGGGLQIAPNGMHVLADIGLADEMIREGSIAESLRFPFAVRPKTRPRSTATWSSGSASPRSTCAARRSTRRSWPRRRRRHRRRFEKRLVSIEDRPDQPVVAHFADGTSAEGDF